MSTKFKAELLFSEIKPKFEKPDPTFFMGQENYLESIVGLDEKEINFKLINEEGSQNPISGFLVEIYLSQSDGRLIKLDAKDERNPVTGQLIKKGFENYFSIKVDK